MHQVQLTGRVQHGAGRGKGLGFPTINLALTDPSLEDGIYISLTEITGRRFASLAFIGAAVTFGETERQAEVYLLDTAEDLYGQSVVVTLKEKIRDNQQFASAEALTARMNQDLAEARTYFAVHPLS